MSGHQRVLRESEVVVDHGNVGVADSAMGYLDVDLVKADLTWVVLEQFQPALGGPGGVSADHHGGVLGALSLCPVKLPGLVTEVARLRKLSDLLAARPRHDG